MVDRGVAARKIAALLDAVARIREVLPASPEAFLTDRTAREVVALNVLVGVEEAIDLAAHWLADEGMEIPSSYAEIFRALAGARVLEPALADRLSRAAALRNLIAHRYGVLDWLRLYAIAHDDLGDLEEFAAAMARAVGAPEG